MKSKPSKNELFAKHSSLALAITKETQYDFDFHVYNRRTRRIIYRGKIPMMTMRDCMDISKIETKKKPTKLQKREDEI